MREGAGLTALAASGPAPSRMTRGECRNMTESRVKIALDAVGGDFAPAEIVHGAILAARRGNVEISLVGPRERIEAELRRHNTDGLPLWVVDAEETIAETERPAQTLLRRPNAAISVAARLVGAGHADALVGAGNSGAFLVAAARHVGCLAGVSRAAVGTSFPFAPRKFLLDAGVNVDCKPEHLLAFAALGVAYARVGLGVDQPRVGLLSVGAEETKGSAQVREAHQLFKRSCLDFVGNVEGSDILDGPADVIVCDGALGNALLKYTEGYSSALLRDFERSLERAGLDLPAPLHEFYRRLEQSTDLSLGGQAGLLLGMRQVCMLCHGRSIASEFCESLEKARLAVERGLVPGITAVLREVGSSLAADRAASPGGLPEFSSAGA